MFWLANIMLGCFCRDFEILAKTYIKKSKDISTYKFFNEKCQKKIKIDNKPLRSMILQKTEQSGTISHFKTKCLGHREKRLFFSTL